MHDGDGLCEIAERLVDDFDSAEELSRDWMIRAVDVLRKVAESNIVSVEGGRVFRRVEGGGDE